MSNHPSVRRLAYSMLLVYVILFLVIIFCSINLHLVVQIRYKQR